MAVPAIPRTDRERVSAYTRALLEARARGHAIGRGALAQLAASFRDAASALEVEIAAGANPLTTERARQLKREIVGILEALEAEINKTTTRSLQLTVQDLQTIHQRVLARIADGADVGRHALTARLDRLPVRALAALNSRRVGARAFQTLVRRNLLDAAPALDRMLSSAVARGVSAATLTKDVAKLLAGKDVQLADYGLRTLDANGLRTVYSDARRIARSEIANALTESNRQALHDSGIVKAAKWQLSGNHAPSGCECEDRAEEDLYGLGPGMHLIEEWPPPQHPNESCTQGGPVVFFPPSEWGARAAA